MIAGADWFQGKWLIVLEQPQGKITLREVSDFGDVLGWKELEVLAIDIPIGFPERVARSATLWRDERFGLADPLYSQRQSVS